MQSACMYVCSLTLCHLSDLKRFSDSNARARKLSTYVNFPLKELELKEFSSSGSGRHPEKKKCSCAVSLYSRHYVFSDGVLSPPAERVVYNLYAVSNHSGNTLGGHYTAFCRHPTLGEWHFYNDARYGHFVPHRATRVAVGKLQCRCKPFFSNAGSVPSPPVKFAAATPTCSSMNWSRRRTASISPAGCRGGRGATSCTEDRADSACAWWREYCHYRLWRKQPLSPSPTKVLRAKWFMWMFR